MLVRGGVEHDVGLQPPHERGDAVAVADVGEVELGRALELTVHVVQVGLVVVEQDQAGGAQLGDLLGDLGADRAAGPGDEHGGARDDGADALDVGGDLRPAEEVLDVDVAGVAHRRAVVEQLAHRGQHLERHLGQLGALHDLVDQLLVGAGDGDQHLVGLVVGHDRREVGDVAHDGHAEHRAALLAGIVVDDDDRHTVGLAGTAHLAHDRGAGVAGTDDGHPRRRPGVGATTRRGGGGGPGTAPRPSSSWRGRRRAARPSGAPAWPASG